jgi:hypothetical protein
MEAEHPDQNLTAPLSDFFRARTVFDGSMQMTRQGGISP